MVIKKGRKIKIIANSSKKHVVKPSTKYIKASDVDFDEIDDTDGILDAIDDVADNVEDLQDAIDDVKEDDVEIAMNNNIADHFIAECDKCNGIFISAVVDSDQIIDHVAGTCPLCGKETEQYLKWVIKRVSEGKEG